MPTFFFPRQIMLPKTMTYDEQIRSLVEPIVETEGMELVDLDCLKMKTRWLVRLYIDKEGGVNLEDCASISNQVGDIMDVHDLPAGPFTLEVSSPGLDRPLARDKDFIRYRGSRIKLKLNQPVEGSKNFTGVLLDYIEADGGKNILMSISDRSFEIPRSFVKKANLVYEF